MAGYKNLTDTKTERKLWADMFRKNKKKYITVILPFGCLNETCEIQKLICGEFAVLRVFFVGKKAGTFELLAGLDPFPGRGGSA